MITFYNHQILARSELSEIEMMFTK